MKLNIAEDGANSIVIEFVDMDRSLPEMIKSKLIGSEEVKFVGVVKERPDVNTPKLIVKSSKNARTIVLKAVEELQDDIKELSSKIPKK